MRIFCGIDGGVRGGLAVVSIEDGTAPALIASIDIPVAGTGAKERVDPIAIRDWVLAHHPEHAFIERAQAMPRQGASSGFKYGRAVGAIETAIMLAGVPLTIVEPSAWKKFHSLRGKNKEGARCSHALSRRGRSVRSQKGSRESGGRPHRAIRRTDRH